MMFVTAPEQKPPPKSKTPTGEFQARIQSVAIAPKASEKIDAKVIKDEAHNFALNALSIVKEKWSEYKSADKYDRYKIMVIAAWVLLSLTNFGIACSGGAASFSNGLDAEYSAATSPPAIFNRGSQTWSRIRVRVNKTYFGTFAPVAPGKEIILSRIQLVDEAGNLPISEKYQDVVLSVDDEEVELLRDGERR